MFATFSQRFWALASDKGFKLDYWLGPTGTPSMDEVKEDVAYMAFQRLEMATLNCLHIVDTTKLNWKSILASNAEHLKWAEGLLDRVKNVAIIYVLTGEGPPPWYTENPEEFIDYHGQPAYSVFWWLDITTGAVSVPKNQPAQLFGIRSLLEKARTSETEVTDGVMTQYTVKTLTPIHRIPYLTIAMIAINAVILVLIYLAGFPADMFVPARFGAIVPYRINVHGEWWRLFTAMFIHFGVEHFFPNTIGLIVFGTRLERYFGRTIFLTVYIVSGLMGSWASLLFTQGYAAGASGAIYGLIGAIFAYTRLTRRDIEHMNWYTLSLFIGIGIVLGFLTPGVDNFGHLGGLIGGLGIGGIMVGVLRLRGKG